jgi:hypothetical protein
MSDADNFLTRWSRRKRALAEESAATADERRAQDRAQDDALDRAVDTEAQPAGTPTATAPAQPAFDLTKLPSIDSITADTDMRAFFAPGVPAELTRAALRRAWVADPQIRDFVGLVENGWDFNNPASIPGFGPLEMTDELRREVARMFGNLVPENVSAAPAPRSAPEPLPSPPQPVEAIEEIADAPSGPVSAAETSSPLPDYPATLPDVPPPVTLRTTAGTEIVAVQKDVGDKENLQTSARRGHGRALPQ